MTRAVLAAGLLLVAARAGAETHHLKPTVGVPTYAVRPPVLTVQPGDVLESESLWGEWYEKPGGKWPGEVGPIAIAGAEPGDTLVVEILKLRPNRDTAVSTQGGHFGALVPDHGTAMLNDDFPRGRYVWRLDRARMTATVDLPGSAAKSSTVALQPMLGRVAVAPEGDEAFGGLWPGPFGGNMDVSDIREGAIVYLPVFHAGALFYFGDAHALMGDGEVCGSGLETSMEVAFRFGLRKKQPIAWPRLEDAEHLMVAGSARPLSDATRIAFVELIGWLVADYGYSEADAYQIVSQTASVRVANMVDPLYTVVARFPKRLLPARPAAGQPGLRLGDMSWTDAEQVLDADRVVVLPIGAGSKEHGPHLLLRNDAIEAEYLARRVVAARPVALLPTLSYGFYPAFLEYPGSTSLSFATQRDAVVEIVRSIARYGPRRFYALNTGVSTLKPLAAAAGILAAEGVLLRFTDIARAGHAEASPASGECTHADEVETSMILYMEPGAVRMDRAAPSRSVSRAGPFTRDPARSDAQYAPSGGCGDPSRATWQSGQKIVEALVAGVLEDIDAVARAPLPEGRPRSPVEPGESR